jgi:hypothetical protein
MRGADRVAYSRSRERTFFPAFLGPLRGHTVNQQFLLPLSSAMIYVPVAFSTLNRVAFSAFICIAGGSINGKNPALLVAKGLVRTWRPAVVFGRLSCGTRRDGEAPVPATTWIKWRARNFCVAICRNCRVFA